MNSKISESSVMITEADRYMKHSADMTKAVKDSMQEMMVSVDKISDLVREIELVCESDTVQSESNENIEMSPESSTEEQEDGAALTQ